MHVEVILLASKMDFGTVLSVAQTLFAILKRSDIVEICSILGYKSQLNDLSRTVATISCVLLDAESKQDELSYEAQLWIEELKEAVYNADDLLDVFVTLAEQKQLMEGGIVSKKVRLFFSRFNPLGVAYNMFQAVSKIRKKLNAIAIDHSKFGFGVNYQPVVSRRVETCSYVYRNDIVGREVDVEKVVSMLLDSDIQRDVSFLTIVGIGGLGKTTLAQLLYNDERVISAFPLRMWASVSDHDQTQMDLEAILHKILASSSGHKLDGSVTLDGVQSKLREKLAGKRYLLVLDDVWNESRDEWLKFIGFLMGGQRGSCVVVTTRSKDTARIVGNGNMYELEGLSDDDSWRLFEKMAFQQANPPDELVKIGQMIVKKCVNVPLAIRAVGSLLHGQDATKWQTFERIGLAKIRHGKNGIMSVLKLSYENLESPLKSCFSYCAVFPKDFKINKETITKIHNLQILRLRWCMRLKELPKHLNRLVKLTVLDIIGCEKLTSLAPGMGRLTRLHSLCLFMVGKASSSVQQFINDLEDLRALNKLKGHLQIKIRAPENDIDVKGKAYLKAKEYLSHIHLLFEHGENCQTLGSEEVLLEELQPHFSLMEFMLEGYKGVRIPRWAKDDNLVTNLPGLVSLQLTNCSNLQCFPWLGQLRQLKVLKLDKLPNLEYVENNPNASASLFSCLEEVKLIDLPKLRGWCPGIVNSSQQSLSCPGLKTLKITHCPEMKIIPVCPSVEYFRIYDFDRSLELEILEKSRYTGQVFASSSFQPKQWMLCTSNIGWLKTVPLNDYMPLTGLIIERDEVLKSLSEVGEWFQSLSSLRFLELKQCGELKSLSGGLEHLTALEVLHILGARNLVINPGDGNREEDVVPWRHLAQTLRSLKLEYLPKLVNLPKGLQYLTSLQSLQIWCASDTRFQLQCLPKWMPKLSSLRQLLIRRCSDALVERCRNPTGEDWPNIQHIPLIDIKTTRW